MSLAAPSALILAGLALPIIVLYILKVRLRRVPVSTNLFWKQIYDEKPPRSIWQQFRHLLSLLIQLLLLGLLVFALADPYLSWQALQARRIVAVIDTSASMQANDVTPSRFDASIDAAVDLVEGMRFRDKMAIVIAGSSPEVLLGMSDHVPTLKRALRSIKVSDNPTELESAIELGKQLVGDHSSGSVVVFTDACATSLEPDENDLEASSAESARANSGKSNNEIGINKTDEPPTATFPVTDQVETKVEYRVFCTEAANVGITQFQVRRSLIDMLGYEVLVTVRNASSQRLKCRLEIELSDSPVDVLPLELEPNELWSRSLEKTSLEGGRLIARLTNLERDADDTDEAEDESGQQGHRNNATDEIGDLNHLLIDDVASAMLPPQRVQDVLVITQGNLFLRTVFQANPLVNVTVASDFPDQWPSDTLIVLHNRVPEQLPAGNVFVVDPTNSCDEWDLGEVLENPIVTRIDSSSELMTHVRLDNVLMPEARKLDFKSEPHVLADALSNNPVYAYLNRREGKVLILSVNLERSDLAFRTAFPIMATNALGWFAGSTGNLRESASTGDIVRFELDHDAVPKASTNRELSLLSPTGARIPVVSFPRSFLTTTSRSSDVSPNEAGFVGDQPNSTTLSLGPFNKSGIWKLESRSSEQGVEQSESIGIAEFAVNLSNQRETDLRPPEEMLQLSNQASVLGNWFTRPVWYYLIGLVCVLFVTEWFLYQRRFIS